MENESIFIDSPLLVIEQKLCDSYIKDTLDLLKPLLIVRYLANHRKVNNELELQKIMELLHYLDKEIKKLLWLT